MRAAERGLTPVDLAALGDAHGRPAWVSAARLYEEYLDVVQLRAGTPDLGARLDPAVVVDEAAQALLTWEDEVPGAVAAALAARRRRRPPGEHVGDGAAAAGARRRRRARAAAGGPGRGGADVPRRDAVAGRARGSSTGRDRASSARARSCCAPRGGTTPALRDGGRPDRRARRCGRRRPAPAGGRRRRPAAGTSGSRVLPSTAQEAAFVAHALRSAHVERGVAVGARWPSSRASGAQVTALRRALAGASVPVSVLGSDVPLREEPAVAAAAGRDAGVRRRRCRSTPTTAARLACSPLGGLDAVGLRRVRRALRAQELAAGRRPDQRRAARRGARAGDDAADAAGAARPVARLARVLAAGRAAARAPAAPTRRPCCGRCGTRPSRPSRGGGPRSPGGAAGERADRDLDAVLALFRAAETFVDRMPRSAPARVRRLAPGAGPAVGLARRARPAGVGAGAHAGGRGRPGVGRRRRRRGAGGRVARPAAARLAARRAGARRPRGRPRGARRGRRRRDRGRRARRGARRRAAVVRRRVLACPPLAAGDRGRRRRPPAVAVPRARGPVRRRGRDPRAPACPRRSTCAGSSRSCGRTSSRPRVDGVEPDPAAARTLARLAAADVAGADPAQWHGLAEPSSDAPAVGPDERVPVSPSKVETAQRCALRWALEAAGGTASASGGQNLGTLLHAIAQEHPQGTRGGAVRRARPPVGRARARARAGRRSRPGARRTRWCTGSPATCGPPASRCWSRARSRSTPTGPSLRGSATGSSCVRGRAAGRRGAGRRPQDRRQPAERRQGRREPPARRVPARGRRGRLRRPARRGDERRARSWSSSARARRPRPRRRRARAGERRAQLGARAGRPGRRQDGRVDVRGDRQRPVRPLPGPALLPGPRRGRAGGRMTRLSRPRHDLSAAQIAALVGQPPPTPSSGASSRRRSAPSLVVAGAGSGKTETMAARVVWLLANGLVAARPGARPDVHAQGRRRAGRAGAQAAAHARPGGRGRGRRARRRGRRRARTGLGGPRAADDLDLQLLRRVAGRRPRAAARARPVGAAARRGGPVAARQRGRRGVERRPRHRRRDLDRRSRPC